MCPMGPRMPPMNPRMYTVFNKMPLMDPEFVAPIWCKRVPDECFYRDTWHPMAHRMTPIDPIWPSMDPRRPPLDPIRPPMDR